MTVVACLLAESMFVPRVVSDAPCRHQSARTFQRQTGWSGIPRIVAFRFDILPDRAKKILACVGADQVDFVHVTPCFQNRRRASSRLRLS